MAAAVVAVASEPAVDFDWTLSPYSLPREFCIGLVPYWHSVSDVAIIKQRLSEEDAMVGFARLLVCGGLFVAGYYLGRQSYRLESNQDLTDPQEPLDAVADSEEAAATEDEGG